VNEKRRDEPTQTPTTPPGEHPDISPNQAPVTLRRGVIPAWGLWDWGSNAFNTVMLTFVFSVYITTAVADDELAGTQAFSSAQAWAGLAIALLAPAVGSLADSVGNRRRLLTVSTVGVVVSMALLFFARPEQEYLAFAVIMMAIASVFSELSGVFYNAMLLQISTPRTIGRISGTAWALGYLGGLVALVIVLFGFVQPEVGLFGVTSENGLNLRAVALFCATWFLVFALPLLILAPVEAAVVTRRRWTPVLAYRELVVRIVRMWREERTLLHFLLASAIYRDGLAAVFTFAGILAANAYGFSQTEVIYFAIAASVTAGAGAWIGGKVDDRLGAKKVIVGSLVTIISAGLVILAFDADAVFWVAGLALSTFVGPVQSASRSLLSRITPLGAENENFGLYATTGRAVSFLAPSAFALSVSVFGFERAGILGIVVILTLGLAVFAPIKLHRVLRPVE